MDYLRLIIAAVAGVLLSAAYHNGGLTTAMSGSMAQTMQSFLSTRAFAYRNCAAARAAGAAPLRRGEPGYAPWLDRDNDGIGCE